MPAANDARFDALVNASLDIVYRMSPDWTRMEELDGRGLIPATDKPLVAWMEKYIPVEERDRVSAAVRSALENRSVLQLEHRVINVDKKESWVIMRAVPVLNDAGTIIEWLGFATDITARKKAEEALKDAINRLEQQTRLYETITASTPDLIYVFDLQYRFTYANEALLNMWGKTWDTAVGKGLRENGYEEWHALMHEREIDYIRETKTSLRGEVSFPHATLGKRIYDYILNPVIDANGEVIAVAGTTRDITDIRNAEAAISESETRFRTMAESTDVMIAVSDEHGGAVYFNEAWVKTTGRNSAELLREGWMDLMHPDDKARITKIFHEALKEKKAWQWDFRMRDKKGGYIWLLTRGTPRFRPDGSFAGYISSTIDITEIKENEQRKDDFISMVSHELKTPLTSLNAYVQVLAGKAAKTEDQFTVSALNNALKQVRKMTTMINGFLNVSRLETGKMVIDKQNFDVAQLIKDEIEETSGVINDHQIVIEPGEDAEIYADRQKIGQVINNLVANAVKYSPGGSTVKIGWAASRQKVTVSVKDEGIGIGADDLPRLFERYYRVKDVAAKHIAGFGIGLYLCSEIIHGNNGEIWAESTLGQGSTFYFSLPGGIQRKPALAN
jgi:PAS domain S-box-containing protein